VRGNLGISERALFNELHGRVIAVLDRSCEWHHATGSRTGVPCSPLPGLNQDRRGEIPLPRRGRGPG
jgi:hypothetical protein